MHTGQLDVSVLHGGCNVGSVGAGGLQRQFLTCCLPESCRKPEDLISLYLKEKKKDDFEDCFPHKESSLHPWKLSTGWYNLLSSWDECGDKCHRDFWVWCSGSI